MTYLYEYETHLGSITMAGNKTSLTGLWFQNQKYFGATLEKEHKTCLLPVFEHTIEWLNSYFEGKNPSISLSLAPSGSPFCQAVWRILSEIPYGEVTTYGTIARRIATEFGIKTMSAQAVGGAVGHNPISILIPCHRVVGSKRKLTGYAGGLDKKTKLLLLEGLQIQNMQVL